MQQVEYLVVSDRAQKFVKAYDEPICLDVALTKFLKCENGVAFFDTDIKFNLQPRQGIKLHVRSSTPKKGWMLANSTGIIDTDYLGNLLVQLTPTPYALLKMMEKGKTVDEALETLVNELELPQYYVQIELVNVNPFEAVLVENQRETKRSTGGIGSSH